MSWFEQKIRARGDERRKDILRFVRKGLTNKEIGRQLNISDHSVKVYVKQLFIAYEVTNRTELAGLFGNEEPEPLAGDSKMKSNSEVAGK
jgi:DNA-binding NarL/FixJ family response regulator